MIDAPAPARPALGLTIVLLGALVLAGYAGIWYRIGYRAGVIDTVLRPRSAPPVVTGSVEISIDAIVADVKP